MRETPKMTHYKDAISKLKETAYNPKVIRINLNLGIVVFFCKNTLILYIDTYNYKVYSSHIFVCTFMLPKTR